MKIGGLQKLSLLDYPEYPSAIIFTQGCNFRCQFCYNPMLVWPTTDTGRFKKDHHLIKEGDLFDFLKKREGKLEGVVITGGEPTLQPDLLKFLEKIKKMGFKIKLDTNGTNPEILEELLITPLIRGERGVDAANREEPPAPPLSGGQESLIDYIAMDLKAPFKKYGKITGVKAPLKKIKQSIKIIMSSGLPYEFRTTVVPGLLDKEDIKKIGELIKGASRWYLQFFKSDTDLINKNLEGKKAFSEKEMAEMAKIGKQYVKNCEIR